MAIVGARTFAHAGAWFGLAVTAYTNWQAAPAADLRVAYLAVPVLLACVSECLIQSWAKAPVKLRVFLSIVCVGLIATSYEHYRHMILAAHGTPFSALVGAAVVDVAIFACVLATCLLPPESSAILRSSGGSSVEAPVEAPILHVAPEDPPTILRAEPPLELAAEGGRCHRGVASSARGASAELRRIVEAYPFAGEPPRPVDIKNLIKCGDGKAGNLRRAYLEKRTGAST